MGTSITKTKGSSSTLHSRLGLNGSSSSSKKNGSQPPEIIRILASVLQKNIQRNEKVLKRSRNRENVTIFHGTRVPAMSIKKYMGRVFEYSGCSPSCFVVAYIYMDRFVQRTASYITSLNVHRLFIASMLVAIKFLEDEHFNNAHFAKIGGISRAEMNKLELKLLLTVNYRLHVTLDTFNQYCLQLETEGEGASGANQSSQFRQTVRHCVLRRTKMQAK